jgi:toxin ParE1/3/4
VTPQIVRTAEAQSDLWEILLFIARDNEDAAFRLIDTIDEKLRMLAEFPGAGQARPELLPNLRSFPVGRYLIFYRPIENGIEVLRVIHGARNLRRLFRR